MSVARFIVLSSFTSNALFALDTRSPETQAVANVVAVVGEWHGHDNGSFRITKADLEKMVENFNSLNIDLVVDYEHQTLTKDQAPAAGWIKSLKIDDNKLLAEIIWTDKAKEFIDAKEYKYLSPVFVFNAVDEKSGLVKGVTLHSVALTNTPFLDELGEVKANSNKPENSSKNDDLENELVETLVENAILCNKITQEQKTWALNYCKKDKDGFKTFLENAKGAQIVINNNQLGTMGDQFEKQSYAIDVVAMATKS